MKILMVIPCFVPAWGYGGPLQVCYLLGKALVRQGHQVTVLTTDTLNLRQRVEKREEVIDGIEVVRFPNLSNRFAKKMNIYTPMGVGAWLKNNVHRFDVVHLHDFFFYPNIQVCKWAVRFGVPYLIQPHGCAVPKPERGRAWVKEIINRIWGRKVLRSAKAVIAVTEREAGDLGEYLPEARVRILPNGVEVSPAGKSRDWPYARYGIPPGVPVIISVGRLHRIKGFDFLLDSFIHLQRRLPEVHLCIVGPDEGMLADLQEKSAAAGIQKQVVFTGLVVGTEKGRLLAAAELFALFSHDEPFSLVTLEAAAHGTPVLVSSSIGIAPLVKEKGAGEVVDSLDAERVALIMQEMLRLEVSAGYRKNLPRLLEQFDLEQIARLAVKFYSD